MAPAFVCTRRYLQYCGWQMRIPAAYRLPPTAYTHLGKAAYLV